MPPPPSSSSPSSSLVTVGNLATVLRTDDKRAIRDWDMGRDRDSGAMMTTFVVIIAPGSRGDVAPLLALAQALKTQHVDVAFACHAKYAQAAEDNGYNAHSQNFTRSRDTKTRRRFEVGQRPSVTMRSRCGVYNSKTTRRVC